MNPTRALGALLVVVGLAWFLAVPTVLPAAYHGYVHTGHEHAQYAATTVDPALESATDLRLGAEHAATLAADREWVPVRVDSLPGDDREAVRAALAGEANATDDATRDRYRRLASTHRFVHTDDGWHALDVRDTENYTVLGSPQTDAATVVGAIAVAPASLPAPAAGQARTLVDADGAVLVSGPVLPTPLYLQADGHVVRVRHVGEAPTPPSAPALGLFLVPGAVLALVGASLLVRY